MKRLLCLLSLLALPLFAADVKLGWDPSETPNVVYRVYVSTNAQLATNLSTSVAFVEVGTNLTATVTNLSAGRWYFVATALFADRPELESDPSNMVDTLIRIGRIMSFRLITVTVP